MKKLFLIPAALFLLSSCEKEDENQLTTLNQKADVKMQMQGEWSNNYKSTHFYNDAGNIAYKEVDSLYLDVRHTFSGDNMHISHPNTGSRETFNYAIPDSSETTYVVLSKNGKKQDHYQVVAMTDSTMVWEATVDWAGYPGVNSNGENVIITSRKGVYTYKFKKVK